MSATGSQPTAPRGLVLSAFAAVYLIWGSTYLGIRFAIETLPPFFMGGARFLLAGLILYTWLRLRGTPRPAARHWRNAAVIGACLLGAGNGGVSWAEQKVPSSITALLIGITPLWFALMDWLRPGGSRPSWRILAGILTGFVGMLILVHPNSHFEPGAVAPLGLAALMAASLFWAGGSLYARYTPKPETPLMGVALQMITGGLILFLMGWVAGEPAALHWSKVSARSAVAFAYLTAIGSLVGFPAYCYLLKASTPARVSTYAYVNPVIAVILGCTLGGEALTSRTLWAAAIIIVGVVLITSPAGKPRSLRSACALSENKSALPGEAVG